MIIDSSLSFFIGSFVVEEPLQVVQLHSISIVVCFFLVHLELWHLRLFIQEHHCALDFHWRGIIVDGTYIFTPNLTIISVCTPYTSMIIVFLQVSCQGLIRHVNLRDGLHTKSVYILIRRDSQISHVIASDIVIGFFIHIFGLLHLTLYDLVIFFHHDCRFSRAYTSPKQD